MADMVSRRDRECRSFLGEKAGDIARYTKTPGGGGLFLRIVRAIRFLPEP
jgi:hypothetical protein